MNFWMRWVNLRALREILVLVKTNPEQLRPGDLAALATEKGIIVGKKGQNLSPSTHYHYRRTLERLEFLKKINGRYVLNEGLTETNELTHDQTLGRVLTDSEKEAFSNVILRNRECHKAFFVHFLNTSGPCP